MPSLLKLYYKKIQIYTTYMKTSASKIILLNRKVDLNMFFIAKTDLQLPTNSLNIWLEEIGAVPGETEKLNINVDDSIEDVLSKSAFYIGQLYGLDPHSTKPKPPIGVAVEASDTRQSALIVMMVMGGKSRAVLAFQNMREDSDGSVNCDVTYLYTGSRMRSTVLSIAGNSVKDLFNDPNTWLKYKTTYPIEYTDGIGYKGFDPKTSPYPCERQSEFLIRKRGQELNYALREAFRKVVTSDSFPIKQSRIDTDGFLGITNTQRQILSWWLNDHPDFKSNIEKFRSLIQSKNKVTSIINNVCGLPKEPHTVKQDV